MRITQDNRPESKIYSFLSSHGYQVKEGRKEYHSGCPYCRAGEDRFFFSYNERLQKETFYCRHCNHTGDIVNLLVDIDGYSYRDAFEAVGLSKCPQRFSYHEKRLTESERNEYEIFLTAMLFRRPSLLKRLKNKVAGIKNPFCFLCIKYMLQNGSASDEITMTYAIEETDHVFVPPSTIKAIKNTLVDKDEDDILRKLDL